ncbi:uncharacterized protein DUF3106 [Sphaerotilus hippei]|uniref:Uncharacterized protein DUF3106 n=1 Tax=Sphaerotilus hippei TaxID=744406 RepID=A0A318H4H0_9BURK|nr:DUF3106 domain-containing protein [Sphaerotilus hippei]PXW98600.1 uncharacterized protein DUF3106 [Sphaerotilus hippei]
MKPFLARRPSTLARVWRVVTTVLLRGLVLCAALAVGGASASTWGGPAWTELSARDQHILEPLEPRWAQFDAARKQKWLNVAQQYPRLSPAQQARMRERMLAWTDLSTAERSTARIQFGEVKVLPSAERQARWEAYQALPEEQRRELTRRAAERQQALPPSGHPASANLGKVQPKNNLIETSPRSGVRNRAVGPGLVQASVGASTRRINEETITPRHQQAGMPKIMVSPEFINVHTLLPLRGPQGAAATPPSARSRN